MKKIKIFENKINGDDNELTTKALNLLQERAKKSGSKSDVVYFQTPTEIQVGGNELVLYSAQNYRNNDFKAALKVKGKRIIYSYDTGLTEPQSEKNKIGYDELYYEPMTDEILELLISNL